MKTRVGIRREDKNIWERRTPLIPSHVEELAREHPLEFRIQPSSIRVFRDEDYRRVGAAIEEDLSSCSVVFAVKEIPLDFIREGQVYAFFSHTTKGQPHNMPLLKKMIDLECTLIDYEKIEDENNMRLVFFGTQAGQAGMIDTLWALGQRLTHLGTTNPFYPVKKAHQYNSLVEAKEEIKKAGWQIYKNGLEASLVPLVCGFAGYGRVSKGAQEIFDLLPVEEVFPEKLRSFIDKKDFSGHRVYKVIFKEEHMVVPVSEIGGFDLQDYYRNPEKYKPVFDSYVPHLSILMNCIYWAPQFPRFVTRKFLNELWKSDPSPRLKIIGDISCDVEGSVECTVRATDPENPVFVYDPLENKVTDGIGGRGVVVMAVDNLPAEIAMESSVFFSRSLKPFVPEIAAADFSGEFQDCHLPQPIKKAVLLYRGNFTPGYEYMKKHVE